MVPTYTRLTEALKAIVVISYEYTYIQGRINIKVYHHFTNL